LQTDQTAAQRLGGDLGQFGLAYSRRSFDQNRLAHLESEKSDGRELAIADILLCRKLLDRLID
jgi:hypothetical protein